MRARGQHQAPAALHPPVRFMVHKQNQRLMCG